MTKKIIYIILGAIALIALVVLLWMWFLNRPLSTPTIGTFGAASSTQGTIGGGNGDAGNISNNINQNGLDGSGQTTGTSGGILNNQNSQSSNQYGAGGASTITQTYGGATGSFASNGGLQGQNFAAGGGGFGTEAPIFGDGSSISGGQWLLPPPTAGRDGIGVGLGTDFNPRTVNQLNTGSIGGTPGILGNTATNNPTGTPGLGLEGALVGAGIGTALCTAGLLGGVTVGGASTLSAGGSVAGATALGITSVPVTDKGAYVILGTQLGTSNALQGSQVFKADFLDCMTRTIARAALQQITASVVNWINSGFNGSPSFVTNYQQFFQNVADVATGEYIKGSALSFLCSPFQLQIRIAIAKSYANRNAAASCSLSKVIGNVESFMNGKFSQGGWPGLLQFTTVPTNNPYGAYAYAQIGLQNAQLNASANARQNMTPSGFLNFQQPYDCKPAPGPAQPGQPAPATCKYRTATPGSIIEASLIGTENSSLNSLNMAKNFDEIIGALITQLMTRTLYGGLTSLSGNAGYQTNFLTPDQQQAQDQAQALMTAMQSKVVLAQQYGEVAQGSISDIQSTQQQVNSLRGCWNGWATGSGLSPEQLTHANERVRAASTTILQLDQKIDAHNDAIVRANTAIAKLQALQTKALSVASLADSIALIASYNSAEISNGLFSSADVLSAQQNRATLQTQLNSIRAATEAESQQCYAYGN